MDDIGAKKRPGKKGRNENSRETASIGGKPYAGMPVSWREMNAISRTVQGDRGMVEFLGEALTGGGRMAAVMRIWNRAEDGRLKRAECYIVDNDVAVGGWQG